MENLALEVLTVFLPLTGDQGVLRPRGRGEHGMEGKVMNVRELRKLSEELPGESEVKIDISVKGTSRYYEVVRGIKAFEYGPFSKTAYVIAEDPD